jgi:sec-independent protein translocase protein TatB
MFPEGRIGEFLIVAVVALIFVGPKDLPILLRKLGQFMARMRAMAAEFRASFDEMARQSELDELRKEVEAMRKGQLDDLAAHTSEANQAFDEISQGLSDVGVSFNSPASYPYTPAQTEDFAPVEAPKPKARKAAGKPAPAKKAPARAPAAKKSAAAKTVASKTVARPKAAAPKAAVAKAPAQPAAKPRARKATVS